MLLLHFSCHGIKDESGELFFATRNTRPNRLGSTAISANFIQRCMRASRSRSVVLLLDCCYGGAFSQGVTVRASGDLNVLDSFPGGRLGGGRGRAVITASSSIEYAFEGERLADDHDPLPSVFTAALVEGLTTGDADRDQDGWVSLNELYEYVFDKVRERNPHQTPSRDVEMQGELYLARSRRRRIRPLPVPPDLRAAASDANMFTRLGAVGELRSRLIGDNLSAAVGAYTVLADMAGTDIRYVADAAAAALAEAAVRPTEPQLRFDSVPARRTVRLLGPPIARACAFEASDPWIRVAEAVDGFEVSVDTTRTSTLDGHVTVKGPTGEVVIPVHVRLAPDAQRPPPLEPAPSPEPALGPPAAAGWPRLPWTWRPRTTNDRMAVAALALVLVLAVALGTTWIIDRVGGGDDSPPGVDYSTATSVAFSHDGKIVATTDSDDNTIRLWNPATGQLLLQPLAGHEGDVKAVAFSPDGKLLATGSDDDTVRLWNATSGLPLGPSLGLHSGDVTSVAFSPDGTLLASGSSGDNAVRLWNPATGQPVGQPLLGHTDYVRAVTFSTDGKLLASASDDRTVRLWNPATGLPARQPFNGHTDIVRTVAFSPDGKTVASGGDDDTVRLWNATTGLPIGGPITGHGDDVMGVAFSPDGKLLATGSLDATIRLWSAAGRFTGRRLDHGRGLTAVAFSPDGRLLAGGTLGDAVLLWSPGTGRRVGAIPPPTSPSPAASGS